MRPRRAQGGAQVLGRHSACGSVAGVRGEKCCAARRQRSGQRHVLHRACLLQQRRCLHICIWQQRLPGRDPLSARHAGVEHTKRRECTVNSADAGAPGLRWLTRRPQRVHVCRFTPQSRCFRQQARVGGGHNVSEQHRVPLAAQCAAASHVVTIPDVAPVAGQLKEGVDVDRQAGVDRQGKEAEGTARGGIQCGAVHPCGDGCPGQEPHAVALLARLGHSVGAAAAQRLAEQVGDCAITGDITALRHSPELGGVHAGGNCCAA